MDNAKMSPLIDKLEPKAVMVVKVKKEKAEKVVKKDKKK